MRRSSAAAGRSALSLAVVLLTAFVIAVPTAGARPTGTSPDGVQERDDIYITSNEDFNPANGVRSGAGTKKNPFVISGWKVSRMYLADTGRHVVIRDNLVTGQLTLNWNGDRIKMVRNEVGDLRVNQNVNRTGDATSGLIAHNTFGIVGQLRHFDGVFAHNVVKGRSPVGKTFSNEAVQFDGFHGARFVNNEIHGWVDVKLHGHHHGSRFDAPSHYHAADEHAEHGHGGHHRAMPKVDHSRRFHKVTVAGNRIYSEGPYALRYTDAPHSVDDRTAASEDNPELNKPHVHFTRVFLQNNKLVGSGLMVDVFNSDDENHMRTATGRVDVRGNTIQLQRQMSAWPWDTYDGITIDQAVDVKVNVVGNRIVGQPQQDRDPLSQEFAYDSGIYLWDIDKANVRLRNNSVSNVIYGVRASQMTENVSWRIDGLDTKGVTYPVYYDSSVKTRPRGRY